MPNLYDNFEKRFTDKWFSAGWVEVETQPQQSQFAHKDLTVLKTELNELSEKIETIAQKQLRLANLAKFYEN
jgi:hypothetical protein